MVWIGGVMCISGQFGPEWLLLTAIRRTWGNLTVSLELKPCPCGKLSSKEFLRVPVMRMLP